MRPIVPAVWDAQYYEMNQSPHPMCKCFWNPLPKATHGADQPPHPGTVPITPATGGGVL